MKCKLPFRLIACLSLWSVVMGRRRHGFDKIAVGATVFFLKKVQLAFHRPILLEPRHPGAVKVN
jgi:hypothetical protein